MADPNLPADYSSTIDTFNTQIDYSSTINSFNTQIDQNWNATTTMQLPNGLPPGAETTKTPASAVVLRKSNGQIVKPDLRVRIIVPNSYYHGNLIMAPLAAMQGIVFPYTPTISYDEKADYSPMNPTHSNYTQHFYKNSSVGTISISGKFTVQNNDDAAHYIATTHLLKALTKMKFGLDSDAGSPPPVCRLNAYGDYMFTNVPVAISSYRVELPNEVDYFTYGKFNSGSNTTSVPVSSTIQITCNPMYSRREIQNFSVNGWLNNYRGNYL